VVVVKSLFIGTQFFLMWQIM